MIKRRFTFCADNLEWKCAHEAKALFSNAAESEHFKGAVIATAFLILFSKHYGIQHYHRRTFLK